MWQVALKIVNMMIFFLKKAISVQVNSHFESFTDTECKWMQIFPNKDAKYITHPFYLNGILQASNF